MLLTIGGWVGLRKENQHILPASGWVVALGKEWVKEWFHLYERFPITMSVTGEYGFMKLMK